MIVREILETEREQFDKVANHPLQTWAWGEFRRQTGVEILRLGLFDGPKLTTTYQFTIHPVPKLGWKIGYFPRCSQPDEAQIFALETAAKKFNLVFIKSEPNVYAPAGRDSSLLDSTREYLTTHQHQPGKPMFTKYSFILDLTPSEEDLLKAAKPKTRYNINVAKKNGVQVAIDDTPEAFEEYLKLLKETTTRQAFYSHDEKYHKHMWQHMHQSGIAHLLKATYQGQTLGVWILFVHNGVLYYPYGASSRKHKEVMANNLLAWEAIRFGQSQGCKIFDMWGSLGLNPDETDPWFGFHRFKQGYGGTLMEFVGTYDYVTDPQKYQVLTLLDNLRWKFLRLRSKLPF